MAAHLRRFVTAPLSIFEFEFASETRAPPPLAAAAKCIAQCIKVTYLSLCMPHHYVPDASVLAGSWGRPYHVEHVFPS